MPMLLVATVLGLPRLVETIERLLLCVDHGAALQMLAAA